MGKESGFLDSFAHWVTLWEEVDSSMAIFRPCLWARVGPSTTLFVVRRQPVSSPAGHQGTAPSTESLNPSYPVTALVSRGRS